jgi:hypothetical protein
VYYPCVLARATGAVAAQLDLQRAGPAMSWSAYNPETLAETVALLQSSGVPVQLADGSAVSATPPPPGHRRRLSTGSRGLSFLRVADLVRDLRVTEATLQENRRDVRMAAGETHSDVTRSCHARCSRPCRSTRLARAEIGQDLFERNGVLEERLAQQMAELQAAEAANAALREVRSGRSVKSRARTCALTRCCSKSRRRPRFSRPSTASSRTSCQRHQLSRTMPLTCAICDGC